MKNLSIKVLAIILAVMMATSIIVRSVADYLQTQSILESANELVSVNYPLSSHAHAIHLNVVQVQQWLSDLSATRGLDGLDDGFDKAAQHADLVRQHIASAKLLDSAHSAQYDQFIDSFEDFYRSGKHMAQAYVDKGPSAGNALMPSFDQYADNLRDTMTPILERLEQSFVDNEHQIARDVQWLHNIGLATTVLLISTLLLMTWVLLMQIVAPLRQVMRMTAEMAKGRADLRKRLREDAFGEVGEICRNVNTFISNTAGHINNVAATANQLLTSSADLKAATEATNEVVQVQQRETDMVSTAINQMAATVQEVASHALNAATAAHEADESGKRGAEIVDDTVAAISALATSIENAAGVIHTVEVSSENISNVSEVISAIAEQTNLLALNAAIEAARAGEQGRGFAVVADEVRALAQRTQESIIEIRQTIDSLQQSARNAVQVMEQSRISAESCVQDANKTQEALKDIARAVSVINDMNTQIASAAEQQGAVADEINRNVVNIRAVAEDAAAESQKVANIGHDIRASVSGLHGMLKQFEA